MNKANVQVTVHYARLGFPRIWEPAPIMMNGQPKGDPIFSAQVVIENEPFFADIIQQIQQAEQKIIAQAWPNGQPMTFKNALTWGPQSHPKDANVTNAWVLHANAKADSPPSVMIEQPPGSGVTVPLTKETARDLIYSGCEAHVAVGLFAYSRSATDGGIGCALNLVMPTGRSFPRFDNRATGQQVLAALPQGAPPAPPLPVAAAPEEQAAQAAPAPATPPGAPASAPGTPPWQEAPATPPTAPATPPTAPAATATPPAVATPPHPAQPPAQQPIPQPAPVTAAPDAPRSPDGKFYWDGANWQPVS